MRNSSMQGGKIKCFDGLARGNGPRFEVGDALISEHLVLLLVFIRVRAIPCRFDTNCHSRLILTLDFYIKD